MTENERFQSDINAGLKSICGPYAQAITVEDPINPETLAATDGKTVYICRRDHPFVTQFPTARIYQAILRAGLGYHEMGHIAYTDFKGVSDFFANEDIAARRLDESWNADTKDIYQEQINALGAKTVDYVRKKILFELAYNIMNVCEDGHLERRLLEETSSNKSNPYGLFADRTENAKIQRGLNFMRLVFRKSLAAAPTPTGKGSTISKAINAMLSMALYGKLMITRMTGDSNDRYGVDYVNITSASLYPAILPRSAKTRMVKQVRLICEFISQTNIRKEYLEMVSDALRNVEEQKKAMQNQSGSQGESQSGKNDQGQSGSQGESQSGKNDQGQSGSQGESQSGKNDQGQSGSQGENLDTNPVPKDLRNHSGIKSRGVGETKVNEDELMRGCVVEVVDEKGISQREIEDALKEEKTEREQLVDESYKVILPPADHLEEEIPASADVLAVTNVLRRSFLRCKQSNVSQCYVLRRDPEISVAVMQGDKVISNAARKISSPLIGQLQNLLEQESREGRCSGAYAGVELDMESVFSPFPCGPFAEETNPQMKLDTAVTVLLDSSGSMQNNGITAAKIATMVLYQICNQLAIPVTIGTYNRNYKHICAADFPGEDSRCVEARIANIQASGGTYEPPFVLWQGNCLIKRPESRKLMFIICDGEPADPGPAELCATARYLSANRVEVFVAGIGSSKHRIKQIYGEKCFIDITNPSELGVQLPRILMDSLQTAF